MRPSRRNPARVLLLKITCVVFATSVICALVSFSRGTKTSFAFIGKKDQKSATKDRAQAADLIPSLSPGSTLLRLTPDQAVQAQNQGNQQILPPSGVIASSRLTSAAIEEFNGLVSIAGSVLLTDVNPLQKYMWSVRAVNPDTEQEVFHQHYVDQMFVVEAGRRDLNFQDQIRFDPGAYRVELVLYKAKPRFRVDNLSDIDFARSFTVVRFSKFVIVR